MALFIYPSELRKEVATDITRAHYGFAALLGVKDIDFRHAVRTLLNHKLLLLPAQVAHHTPVVERMKQVALICGIDVRPITAFNSNKPAPAPAARHTQQSAGAGNP